jgi:hypothetical protein
MAARWFGAGRAGVVTVRPLEEVARQVLVELLDAGDPIVCRLLFDAETRHRVRRDLHGVFCAWGDRQGSFLFWEARDAHAVRLDENEGRLVANGGRGVPLERRAVLDALRAGTLWPGVFLSFLLVSYLPNLPIAGGPRQLHYYRSMIRAANRAALARRGDFLSAFGYNSADTARLAPRRGSCETVSVRGTGLALVDEELEAGWVIEEMTRAPLLPSREDKYD